MLVLASKAAAPDRPDGDCTNREDMIT